jgi:hypothetical protein
VIEVEPMTTESIPENQAIMDVLKRERLDTAVWRGLGGNPAHYLKLRTAMARRIDDPVDVVKKFLASHLTDALGFVQKSSTNTEAIIKVFREKKISELLFGNLKAHNLLLDFPSNVFRETKDSSGRRIVAPSSSSVGLIISENVTDDNL